MKRIKSITAILLIIFTVFSNMGVFAASEEELSPAEREEIIETVFKSWWIYDVVIGLNYTINHIDNDKKDSNELTDGQKKYLEYTSDVYPGKIEMVRDGLDGIDVYNKTKFKSIQELSDYMDTIFADNIFGIGYEDDERYVSRYRFYDDGYLCIRSYYGYVLPLPMWDFENVVDIKNVNGIVTVTLNEIEIGLYGTAKLKKVDGKWMVCGGSIFDGGLSDSGLNYYYRNDIPIYDLSSPSTGENTILYLAIAGAALAAMTALVVRRKRKIVL